jgi:hypothetical protein
MGSFIVIISFSCRYGAFDEVEAIMESTNSALSIRTYTSVPFSRKNRMKDKLTHDNMVTALLGTVLTRLIDNPL